MGFFNKLFGEKEKESLDQGLQKTKQGFLSKITKAIAGKSTVDEEVLDEPQVHQPPEVALDVGAKVQQVHVPPARPAVSPAP